MGGPGRLKRWMMSANTWISPSGGELMEGVRVRTLPKVNRVRGRALDNGRLITDDTRSGWPRQRRHGMHLPPRVWHLMLARILTAVGRDAASPLCRRDDPGSTLWSRETTSITCLGSGTWCRPPKHARQKAHSVEHPLSRARYGDGIRRERKAHTKHVTTPKNHLTPYGLGTRSRNTCLRKWHAVRAEHAGGRSLFLQTSTFYQVG